MEITRFQHYVSKITNKEVMVTNVNLFKNTVAYSSKNGQGQYRLKYFKVNFEPIKEINYEKI